MTVATANNPKKIRLYQIHRWLNPLIREQATLFTHLEPDELRDRLWPYRDQSYEPDSMKEFRKFADALISFPTALPGMTREERARRLEDLERMFRDGDVDGIPVGGSAHPGGFNVWHKRNRSVSLHATNRTGTHGTRLEVDYGPDDPAGILTRLLLEIVVFSFFAWLFLSSVLYPPFDSLSSTGLISFVLLVGFGLYLMLHGKVVTMIVALRWVHRNDFAHFKAFLAGVIEAHEIGNSP